jgi:hypothetical protein
VAPPSKVPPPKPPPPRIAKPQLPPIAAEPSSQIQRGRPGVMAKAKRLTHWEVLFRVGVVIVMLASIALPWWTYSQRLVPLQKQSRDLTSANSDLSAEVDKMASKWSKEETELIRANYKEVYLSLFADRAALVDWLDRLRTQALALGLDVQVDLGNAAPQLSNENVAVLPAAIKIQVQQLQVQPLPNGKDMPYQRLLRLGQQLSTEGKRADLAELNVFGGTASVTNAVLVFNLWVSDTKVQAAAK